MKDENLARVDSKQFEKVLQAENEFLKRCIDDELIFSNTREKLMYDTGFFYGIMVGVIGGSIFVALLWVLSL